MRVRAITLVALLAIGIVHRAGIYVVSHSVFPFFVQRAASFYAVNHWVHPRGIRQSTLQQ
jgi:hypothetical protein